MLRLLGLIGATLLVACPPPVGGLPPVDEACSTNSPPFIGNLVMDSRCTVGANALDCLSDEGDALIQLGEELVWELEVRFNWADPGVDGAGDPPNMVGGMLSGENSIQQFPSRWLYDPEDFEPGEDQPYSAVERGATQGELGLIFIPEAQVTYYSPVTIELRVRDACEHESNSIGCRYLFGTGEWVDCEPPAQEPEE